MEFTRNQISKKLGIQIDTFDRIIKYLSLKSEQKYHEKAHKIVDFFTEEQFNQIKQFLIEHPNKRALFLELTRIEKYGSLENFYAIKNEKSRKTKKERYGDENYVNKEKIKESNINSWEENKEERIAQTKQTKLERYGDENYNNPQKNIETQIKNFGSVENAHKVSFTKSKKTKKERYGNENYVNSKQAKKTKLERYGDEGFNNREKAQLTNLEIYGVKVPTQNKEISKKISDSLLNKSDEEWKEIINKREQTKIKLYNNPNYVNPEKISESWHNKSENEIQEFLDKMHKTKEELYGNPYYRNDEKLKNTCLENLGVDNPLKSEEVKEKIRKTNLKNLGVEYVTQNEDIKQKIKEINNKKLKLAKNQNLLSCQELASIFNRLSSTITDDLKLIDVDIVRLKNDNRLYIKKSDLHILEDYFSKTEMSGTSYSEKEIVDFIKSICNYEIIENSKKIISPKELDIYIPSKNLAIEFDGLYWHDENHIEQKYHLNKTKTCNEKGIDLIHVFEDDWIERKEIVKSMIASRLGIYQQKIFARKCTLKEIEKSQAELFFNENHLQGFAQGTLYLGLFYNDELMQAIIINKKGWHDGNVELTRMVTKMNTQVIGGFGKLMKHVSDYMDYDSITSYIYRAWFNGKGYIESGFKIVKENPPSYSYIVNGKRIHKSYFRKDKIKKLYENKDLNFYDENKTEHENMLNNNIYRIYDCGTIKVIYEHE